MDPWPSNEKKVVVATSYDHGLIAWGLWWEILKAASVMTYFKNSPMGLYAE